jgi:Domain of unknown function (DUF222)/HNH endonuclease
MSSPGEPAGDGVPAVEGAASGGPGTAADALRMAGAGLDYLNSPAAAGLDPAALGGVLAALGQLQSKLAAAHAEVLRRFDAANAHNEDGYGTPGRWLTAMTRTTRSGARAAVAEMRQLRAHRDIAAALAAGTITKSLGFEIADWTGKLPEELRAATDKILLEAAAAGADADDLKLIAVAAYEKSRSRQPDGEEDARRFRDRWVRLGVTFGGAACVRGGLTPECAAALGAVLESLGKKAGPEDVRTEDQRSHDALQLACEMLLRANLVPDRAGASTRVEAHIPLSQLRAMPGAPDLEDAWLRAKAGEDGYLTGKDAETAACDAVTVPVVTGHPGLDVIDKIIAIIAAAAAADDVSGLTAAAGGALRWTVARLAIDFVSGPGGIASVLRTGLLERPYNTRSVPLDIGYSDKIPAAIRRAVKLRDKHCAWPRCRRPAAWCDVHHIVHKQDGGKTSVSNCVLLCQFHHDVCIHRWGWQFVLHPDGTTSAYGPRGQQLHSDHPPPNARAA